MDIIGLNTINNIKQISKINNVNKDINVLSMTTRTRSELLFWK